MPIIAAMATIVIHTIRLIIAYFITPTLPSLSFTGLRDKG